MTTETDTDVHFACKVSELMNYCGLLASPDYVSDCVLDVYENVPGDLDLHVFTDHLTDALIKDLAYPHRVYSTVLQCVCMAISDTYGHLDDKSHGVPVDRVKTDDMRLSEILRRARDGQTLTHREVQYIGADLMDTMIDYPQPGDKVMGSDGQIYTIIR